MIRSFQLILLVAIVLLNACSTSSSQKEIGLQLWSLRDDMKKDVPATIQKVGEMGFSFIEAAGYSNGKFYGMEPLDFKKLLNGNGLAFVSSHTGKALPDADKWDATMLWWDECIDAHAKAGVQYLVQPFMDAKGYGSLEDLKRYCDYFNAIGEKCREKGIRFGYHNHDREFEEVDGVVRYDYMLGNTDPEKVFFQLDLYWIMKGEKVATDYFNNYPGRFVLWHIKDEKELGQSGIMDFASSFNAAKQAGMEHYIIEVERYNFTPLESVKKSIDFLLQAEYVK